VVTLLLIMSSVLNQEFGGSTGPPPATLPLSTQRDTMTSFGCKSNSANVCLVTGKNYLRSSQRDGFALMANPVSFSFGFIRGATAD